ESKATTEEGRADKRECQVIEKQRHAKRIVIATSKLPRFSRSLRFQRRAISIQGSSEARPGVGFPNFAARMAGRRLSKRTRLLSPRLSDSLLQKCAKNAREANP